MGLEDLGNNKESDSGESTGGSSGSRYTVITLEEFEQFLADTPYEWSTIDNTEFGRWGGEYTYRASLNSFLAPDNLEVRVYSTIDKSDKRSRSKGSDAIRTVIFDRDTSQVIAGREHTKRTEGWQRRLREKIDHLFDQWMHVVHICDECNSYMVKRDGKYGEFLGCTGYPECDNTRQL